MRKQYWFISSFVLMIGLFSMGCRETQNTLDADGKKPEDVVRMFVESVQKQEYEKAIKLLEYGDRVATEKHLGRTFEEFCRHRLEVQTYSIEFIGIDKRSRVYYFVGDDHGRKKEYRIYIFRMDDKWRIAI